MVGPTELTTGSLTELDSTVGHGEQVVGFDVGPVVGGVEKNGTEVLGAAGTGMGADDETDRDADDTAWEIPATDAAWETLVETTDVDGMGVCTDDVMTVGCGTKGLPIIIGKPVAMDGGMPGVNDGGMPDGGQKPGGIAP
jgi:hypothetical protein